MLARDCADERLPGQTYIAPLEIDFEPLFAFHMLFSPTDLLLARFSGYGLPNISDSAGIRHNAVHGQCRIHLDNDVRIDLLDGTFQSAFVSKHHLLGDRECCRWQRQCTCEGDSGFPNLDDASLSKDSTGDNTVILCEPAGDLDC